MCNKKTLKFDKDVHMNAIKKRSNPRIVHIGSCVIASVECVGAIHYQILRYFVYFTIWSGEQRLYWRLHEHTTHNLLHQLTSVATKNY